MITEFECTLLDVNVCDFEKKLLHAGAKKIGEYLQKRYIYDFNPVDDNKWLRLRTNGEKVTLTIKKLENKFSIGGTKELEIEVSDFEKTNMILNELGYRYRNYQENRRITYILNEVEIDIDFWPMIPPYVEIEGKREKKVNEIIELLKLDREKITTYDVTSIYNEIYNIDILKIKELRF